MSRKALKCCIEIAINKIDSPGTWLKNRDKVNLCINLFGQAHRTRYVEPVFPLRFNQVFYFERTFWNVIDPQELTELLEDFPVYIELRQWNEHAQDETLLAYIDSNARDFLFPNTPDLHLSANRELYMTRTVDFVGLTPKIELSTYTTIEDCNTPYIDMIEDYKSKSANGRRNVAVRAARRSRSPNRALINNTNGYNQSADFVRNSTQNYERKTVSSVLRARSPSPDSRFGDLGRKGQYRSLSPGDKCYGGLLADNRLDKQERKMLKFDMVSEEVSNDKARMRPPFVVRKVSKNLLDRRPVLFDTLYPLSVKGKRIGRKKSAKSRDDGERVYRRSRSVSPKREHTIDWSRDRGINASPSFKHSNRHRRVLFDGSKDDDRDVEILMNNPNIPARYLHSSDRDYREARTQTSSKPEMVDFSEATIDEISRRVENTLMRSRMLSDSVSPYHHHHHGCPHHHHHVCHCVS